MLVTALFYGSETRTVNKKTDQRLQNDEMMFLCSVARYKLSGEKLHVELREELDMYSLNGKEKQYRETWKNSF